MLGPHIIIDIEENVAGLIVKRDLITEWKFGRNGEQIALRLAKPKIALL